MIIKKKNGEEWNRKIKEDSNEIPIRKGLSFIHFGIAVTLWSDSTSIESSCVLSSNALSISARMVYREGGK